MRNTDFEGKPPRRESLSVPEVYSVSDWGGFQNTTSADGGGRWVAGIRIKKLTSSVKGTKSASRPGREEAVTFHDKSLTFDQCAKKFTERSFPVDTQPILSTLQASTLSQDTTSLDHMETYDYYSGFLSSPNHGILESSGEKTAPNLLHHPEFRGIIEPTEMAKPDEIASEKNIPLNGITVNEIQKQKELGFNQKQNEVSSHLEPSNIPNKEAPGHEDQTSNLPIDLRPIDKIPTERLPNKATHQTKNLRNGSQESELVAINDAKDLFTSSGSPNGLPPVIDNPNSVHAIFHPLFDLLAIHTNFALVIISSIDLRVLQKIFDPSSDPQPDTVAKPELPIRLQDAPRLFFSNVPGSSAAKPTRSFSLSLHGDNLLLDRLLCVAWHRESITLAIGTTRSLMIFKQNDTSTEDLNEFKLHCAFFTSLGWPCSSLFWLTDGLLTKATILATDARTEATRSTRSKVFQLPSSQFFFWKCEFARHHPPPPDVLTSSPLFFENPVAPGDISAGALAASISNSAPVLRDEWHPNTPLAVFTSCSDAPLFSWRAVAGANIRSLSAVPHHLGTGYSDDADRVVIDVRRVVPQPSGRFLAVLYGVSVQQGTRKKSKDSLASISVNIKGLSIPSPIVRLWSLRPNLKDIDEESDESEIYYEDINRRGKVKKKRRFLRLGNMKNSIAKRSCFLSGVSSLLHIKGKSKQHDPYAAGTSPDAMLMQQVEEVEGELQGPEWTIVKQLTTGASDSNGKSLGSSAQKASLMAVLVQRGLVSEEDLAGYQSAVLAYGGGVLQTPAKISSSSDSVETTEGKRMEKISAPNEDVPLGLIPAVIDGPYICTSLNHRAPVIEVTWRDDGPIADGVFIPAVICSLTMDNCITVWLESSPEMELWFEAVILLRLDVSPLKNFFHPVDVLQQPGVQLRHRDSQGSLGRSHAKGLSSAHHFTRERRDIPDIAALASYGLCSAPFEESSVTLCWLSSHHVPFDAHSIHNILRSSQSEMKTRLVELSLLDTRKTKLSDSETKVTIPGVDVLLPRKAVQVEGEGILSFRPSCHSRLGEFIQTVSASGNSAPGGCTSNSSVVCPAFSIATHKLHHLPPLLSVVHRQNSVDFLLVCEVSRGPDGPIALTSHRRHGLWVYTFRELASQPRGAPAVKRLLEPRHLPLPCKVRSLISVECLTSLGLSDVCWGDGTTLCTGDPVQVMDGIILPACLITAITVGGELWSFCVRPTIIQMTSEKQTPFDGVTISYHVHFTNHFSGWRLPFHVLNTAIEASEILRLFEGIPRSMPLAPLPKQILTTDAGAMQAIMYPALARFKMIHWKYFEEHPSIPKRILALDNRGWLSVGSLKSTPPTGETVTLPSQPCPHSSSKIVPLVRGHSGAVIPGKAGQTHHSAAEHFHHHDSSILTDMAGSDLICLHSIGGSWVDGNLSDHVVRSPIDSELSRVSSDNKTFCGYPPHGLPPLRRVLWLPTATQPPIVIAITEPNGRLLALEVSHVPSQCPRVRGLAFAGSFCESLVSALHLTPKSVARPTNPERIATIGSVDAVYRHEAECLLVFRVSLSMSPANTILTPRDLCLLREEHIIVARCFEVKSLGPGQSSNLVQLELSEKRVLHIETIFDTFIDFSAAYIGLKPIESNGIRKGLNDSLIQNPISSNKPIMEVTPHLSVCTAATAGGVLGLLAVYPPLETKGSKQSWNIKQDRNSKVQADSLVGIYDILESGELRLSAWAAVPTRRSTIAGAEFENDEIISVSLNQEWIAVMTSTAQLFLFSLLDSPPVPSAASLPRVFATAAIALGVSVPEPPILAVPVLAPVMELSFRSQLSSLRFNAEGHRRKISVAVSKMESLDYHLHDHEGKVDQREDQVKYFRERKNLFDERLQLDTGRSVHVEPMEPTAESTTKISSGTKSIIKLSSSRCGEMPILSFRRTRGDGLCLLVMLKCLTTLDPFNPSIDPRLEEFRLTQNVTLDLPLQTVPFILLRSRKEGIEGWWKSPLPLVPHLTSLMLHGICWSARSDQLLLSMSRVPNCLQDGCLPMMSMKLPPRLKYLARALSSPRPIYHPASLVGLIKRSNDDTLALKVLKRLLEGLVLWRHAGRPLPPTIDLPIAFLSSKPAGWIKKVGKDNTLRDQLFAKLRNIVCGVSSLELSQEESTATDKADYLKSVRIRELEKITEGVVSIDKSIKCPRESIAITVETVPTPVIARIKVEQGTTKPLKQSAAVRETAAALFGDASSGFTDDFKLDLDDDDDDDKDNGDDSDQGRGVTDNEEEQVKVCQKVEEESFGAKLPESPVMTPMKSFAFGMEYYNEEEIAEASPLPEASSEDLLALVAYLDISLPHNIKWLKTHMNLVPHLSIAESTQLLGLIRLLLTLKPADEQTTDSANSYPFLAAVWKQGASGSQSGAVDIPGCRFLLAYHYALSVTAACVDLVKSVSADIQESISLFQGQQYPQKQETSQIISEDHDGDRAGIINWHSFFPKGLCSVSSLEGDAMMISALESSEDITSPLNPPMATRYALTTSDLCWAIQCESDDVLLQRTLGIWRKLSGEVSGTSSVPKLSWVVLRHAGVGFWLTNPVTATKIASEDIPRDVYAVQPAQDKNPDVVALWYIATGRLPVLRTLYKTARNEKVVEFLSHDFEEERWRAAAIKNAYALVRQRRHELAVAFFILGGSYSEAMDICCGQMDDPQLALFLALLLEHQEMKTSAARVLQLEKPRETAKGLRHAVLEKKLLPLACSANDPWLQCLILWLLGRYEEAVVVTLPPDIRPHLECSAVEVRSLGSTVDLGDSASSSLETKMEYQRRLTVNLFPDSSQRRSTFIGSSFDGTGEAVAGAASHTDDRTTFCCNAIRYSPLNPSIMTYRRLLLSTIQLRRALQESIVASEFVEVVKNVCEKEKTQGMEVRNVYTSMINSPRAEDKLHISAAVVAAVIVLCEEIVNLLDLGEALLYCLSHRLPFQGLQHFTDLRFLMRRIGKSSSQVSFDMPKNILQSLSAAGGRDDPLRVRWNCAVGFSRHACDALGYLTAVKLKETENDVEWMDALFNETVEAFGEHVKPMSLAACAWKSVVDDHGCEHHYQGENFVSWVSRQVEGPVEIYPQIPGTIIELPLATPGPSAPVVELNIEAVHIVSSTEIHAYDEQRHKEAWLVEVFGSALRGMPAWSLLSAKQSWTEHVVFRGVSTCILGLIDLLSKVRRIGTFGPHSFHTVLAKTLTLQAGVKTAVAWATQPSTSNEARQLLLCESVVGTSCIAVSGALLLLMKLREIASQHPGQDTLDGGLQKLTTRTSFLSESDILKSEAWREWPLHLPGSLLWRAVELLLSRMDRLEACYMDSIMHQQSGWLETDDGIACAEYVSAELLKFLDFLQQTILMPRIDLFTYFEEQSIERSEEITTTNPKKTVVAQSSSVSTGANGSHTGAKMAQVLTARSEPMQGLLRAKAEAALGVTMRAIADESSPHMKESMRQLILGVLQEAMVDRLLCDMAATEDSARTILELYVFPKPANNTELNSAVWHGTVCHIFTAFQSLSTRLRETFHGPVAVENYGALISKVATDFPFLPMALTSPLSFPKDPQALSDESMELLEIDNTCISLAVVSAASDSEGRAFRGIWSALNCSRRLQFLLGRGVILGFPSSISLATICPDQLPVHSRVIACLREAPLSISVDRASDAPFVHHFCSLGPPLISSQPFGLGVQGVDGMGQTGRSGLGVLSISTGHGVWETNIVHSVMFHRSFSPTATVTGATNAAAVVATLTGAATEKPESSQKTHHHQILSHHANLFHLPPIGAHGASQTMDFDDDPTRHGESLTQGKLRPYDLAAEVYERQVAEQALIVFNSRFTIRRSGEPKEASAVIGGRAVQSSSDTSHGGTPDDSDAGKGDSSQVSRKQKRIGDRSARRTGDRSRFHRHPRNGRSSTHISRVHHHSLLRLHLLSRHPGSNAAAASNALIDSQELPLYHFNLLLELLLRGLLGPLADLPTPYLEAPSVQSAGGAFGRTCLVDEESALMVSGLSLFPLPGSPQKALFPSTEESVNASKNTRSRTSLNNYITQSGPYRSTAAWVKLIGSLQRRLARNRLVEMQLACLPPAPYQNPTSLQDRGKPMAILRPHPTLPICAGVIADSQVVNTSLGTLVISLWKVGEPHIRELGWLAMPPATSFQKGFTNLGLTAESQRPSTTPEMNTKASLSEVRASSAAETKRNGAGSIASAASAAHEVVGLPYNEAGLIKSLEWDGTGEKLITAHTKGWIAIWQLRSDRHARVDAAVPQRHNRDELVHIGQLEGQPKTNEPQRLHLGLPLLTFKPHTSSCRFASFLQCESGSFLIATSGRGLSPTPVIHHCKSDHGAVTKKNDQMKDVDKAGHIVSAGVDEGVVCIWDMMPPKLGPPQLLMVDVGFEKGSYATDIVVWAARQAILYCGKRGEVRLMNLRNPTHHKWVIHPIGAYQQRQHIRQMSEQPRSDHEDGSITTPVTAGPYAKEIVKMFLLEQSRRLVTCYEDSMVRVWDLSDFCSKEFTEKGITTRASHRPAIQRQARQKPSPPDSYGYGDYLPQQPSQEVITYDCVPLLWETPSPIHSQDTSKLSLVASIMGAVFNVAPGGSPRTLLDAQMASPYHLVTIGADGFVVLTRV